MVMVVVVSLFAAALLVLLFLFLRRLHRRRLEIQQRGPVAKEPFDSIMPQIIPNFVEKAECKAIINAAKERGLRRSTVLSDTSVQKSRTSSNTFLSPDEEAVQPFLDKVELLLGIPRKYYEDVQVVHYKKGQQYKPHFDACFKCDNGADVRRRYTVLMFLNDVPEGGDTSFPELDIRVKPKAGTLVVWKNMDELERIVKESLHAGTPVCKGEKWACQIWIRDAPYR